MIDIPDAPWIGKCKEDYDDDYCEYDRDDDEYYEAERDYATIKELYGG